MQKEEFEILKSLLEKLITVLSRDNPYMPLLLVFLGAVLAIAPQLLFWYLQLKKEKKEKLRELLAEAYKQSNLLTEYYKELVMHKVHKNFWHQSSEYAAFNDSKKADVYYSKHLESSKESFITEFRIRNLFAEYVKTLKSFQVYNGKIEMIDKVVKELNGFKPRKPKTFENIQDADLKEAAIKEEAELNLEYSRYGEYFASINDLIEKALIKRRIFTRR